MTNFFQASKGPNGNGGNGGNPYEQGDAPEEARNTIQALKEVADEIQKLKTPTGNKDSPGMTCRDIAMADPTLKTGYYWINPNGGSISDAIRVFCKMNRDKTQTCLEANLFEYPAQHWTFTRQEQGIWSFAASFVEGEEFNYNSHKSQVKMLQQHADNGKQRVTFKCKDTAIVFNHANNSYDGAVTLLSFDEEVMGARSKKPFRYRVVKDGCQKQNGTEGVTELEVGGQKLMKRLPVMDIGFAEQSSGEFGLELGRACFWEKSSERPKKKKK